MKLRPSAPLLFAFGLFATLACSQSFPSKEYIRLGERTIAIENSPNLLPSPWQSYTSGNPLATAGYSNGVFTLTSPQGGAIPNVWGGDNFEFVYQPVVGNVTIVARVVSYPGGAAGVMLRDGLTGTDIYAFTAHRNGSETHFNSRTINCSCNTNDTGGPREDLPYWVKLVRNGNTITGSISPNGVDWTQIGTQTYTNLASTLNVGLAAAGGPGNFIFDYVAVAGPPDFYVTSWPVNWTSSTAGDTTTYGVGIAPMNGFSGQVTLNINGLPAQIETVANPNPIPSPGLSTLTMTAPPGTPPGVYPFTVTATSGGISHSSKAALNVRGSPAILPPGYSASVIGANDPTATTSYANGVFTLTSPQGSGLPGIWGNDIFEFVYQPIVGDATIIARVVSHPGGSAGVMLRDGLEDVAISALMEHTNDAETVFATRPVPGPNSMVFTHGPGGAAPYWVELVRSGNTIAGFVSPNGANWTLITTQTYTNLASTLYAGLAAATGGGGPGNFIFDHLSVTSTNGGTTPDFSISLPSTVQNVNVSGKIDITTSVVSSGGFTGSVGLTTDTLPDGATVNFNPQVVNGTATSAMILDTTPATPANIYLLNIHGTGGGLVRDASVSVSINSTATQPPAVIVSPAQGTGISQVFTATITDSIASGNIDWVQLLINAGLNGISACYVHYDRTAGVIYLRDNTDPIWAGSGVLGATGTISNSQCTLDTAASSAIATATTVTLNVALTFTNSFAGTRSVFLAADSGGINSGWQQAGNWTIPLPAGAVPQGWQSYTTGDPTATTNFTNGVFTLNPKGGGIPNIWGWDVFEFLYQPIVGDATIVARVLSNPGGQVGVMLRDGLNGLAPYAFTLHNSSQSGFKTRAPGGGTEVYGGNPSLPYWMKLVRSGSTITGLVSPNGVDWTQLGVQTYSSLSSTLYAGLAAAGTGSFTFDHVTITNAALPTFNPPAGVYASAQSVTIGTALPGSVIYYTTDGSVPTTTSTLYSGPINLAASATIQAIVAQGGVITNAASAGYVIGSGQGWYSSTWSNRKAIILDHSKVSGTTNLVGFPILYSVLDGDLKLVTNGGEVGKSDGTDILFTAADGLTKLDHELESYDPITGRLMAWVRIPSLSPTTDTVIYSYFGNSAAADQQNKTGVWDSNYKGVWHLPNGSTLSANDSTGANNGTTNGMTATAGEIGGGASSSGSSQYISMGANAASLHPSSNVTVSIWVQPNSSSQNSYSGMISQDYANPRVSPYVTYKLGLSSGNYGFEVSTTSQNDQLVSSGVPFSNGTWAYVVGTYDGSNAKIYVNGVLNTTTAVTGALSYGSTGDFRLSGNSVGGEQVNATLDEARISAIARSSDWIATEYANQYMPIAFYSVGASEILQAAAPTFSPLAGSYTTPQNVIMSTVTAGASIYYTLDGTTPSTSSSLYSAPISVATTTTINAIAVKGGIGNSPISSATYTFPVAPPKFSPVAGTYTSAQSVTISTTTSNASIYYTTDGTDPNTMSTLYVNPVSVGQTLTLKAIAVKAGLSNSLGASAGYTINLTAATPTFTPSAGAYSSTQSVAISSTTSGARIYYTTDGSTPTTSSSLYSSPINVSSSMTIKAIAAATGMANSSVGSAAYTIAVATPTFSPVAGSYSSAQTVTISTATSGATIYYTTDGSTPTTSSSLYSSPLNVASSMTIKAIGVKSGMDNSAVASATYTLAAATPTFSPVAGSYTSSQSVTISTTTTGSTIYYTTDGSTPTTSSTQYSAPLSVTTNLTINAIAVKTGLANSGVGSAAYTIAAAVPTFSPVGGSYSATQNVTISTTTSGAAIRFTTDGSTPTGSSTLYSSPVSVTVNTTINAIAIKTGMANSAVGSAAYTIVVANPTFSPVAGTYTTPQSVTISSTTAGASFRYTLDGTTPTSTSGTVYSAPVAVNASLTLKAIAYKSGMADSSVSSAAYTITGPAWYNSSWAHRKSITIDHTKVGGSVDLQNFPVLISTIQNDLKTVANGGSVGKADGTDILFATPAGVKLNHELETYNGSTGLVTAWVQVPTASASSDTVIWMYHGNAAAADQQNKPATWSGAGYQGVWHLPNGTTLTANDSGPTPADNGTATSVSATAAEVYGGGTFNGTSSTIALTNPSKLQIAGAVTLSAWVKVTSFPGNNKSNYIVGKGLNGSSEGYYLKLTTSGSTNKLVAGSSGSGSTVTWNISGWTTGTWHYLMATYNSTGTTWALYFDGVQKATASSSTGAISSTANAYIGSSVSGGTPTSFFSGSIDEVRIANTSVAANGSGFNAWTLAEFNNQSSPTTFVTYGAQQ